MDTRNGNFCRDCPEATYVLAPCICLCRVDQTVAVLMRNKERAADIGRAERRVLQPEMARRMDRMNAVKRAEFEKQVQQAVERIVYAAKRRYVRRQEKLDDAGIFHPQANAHR